jgi:hypothetical protein
LEGKKNPSCAPFVRRNVVDIHSAAECDVLLKTQRVAAIQARVTIDAESKVRSLSRNP